MMKEFTVGQYFPGHSILYRLDPRMKLVLTLAFLVAVFIPQNWIGLGGILAVLAVILVISRLPLKLVWRSIRPVMLIVAFTAILNIFYVTGGRPLWDFWIFHITTKGIATAVFIALRVTALVAGSSLLTYTTTPTALTDAMEYLLAPLKIVHINAHELAMMMTIALRFIPTLMEETDRIMSAQKARGADPESGGLKQRVRALIPILIPLFISSFRRAYDLAMAMECRCYRGGEGRTRMKQLRTAPRDWIALGLGAVVIGALIVGNVYIPAVL